MFPLVYDELRRIAHRQLRSRHQQSAFNTTALVHEAYLKLESSSSMKWHDRAHFCAISACAMRQILLNYARRMKTAKRGGQWQRITLYEGSIGQMDKPETLLSIDAGLRRLSELDPRASRVVECRYFGGMNDGEIAEALGISERTVRRDWRAARAFLSRHLKTEETSRRDVAERDRS